MTGPEPQPGQTPGYLASRGADAMRAREPTAKAIEDLIRRNGSGLPTPDSGST